jgi:hypothetical protein
MFPIIAAKWTLSKKGTICLCISHLVIHIGECLPAGNEILHEPTQPELVEALAVRRALSSTREGGNDQISYWRQIASLWCSALCLLPLNVRFPG